MASTLYIQIPSKSVANSTENWSENAFPFCLVSAEKKLIQYGRQNFSDLKILAQGAYQVIILLAASDVTIFDLAVPPMPTQKLKAALPNLLEEQVLIDPAELSFVSTSASDGQCTVSIVSRSWIEEVFKVAQVLEARKLSAYPLSLSLQHDAELATALIEGAINQTSSIEIAIKSSKLQCAGLTLNVMKDPELTRDSAQRAVAALSLLLPDQPVHLFVESQSTALFEEIIFQSGAKNENISLSLLEWSHKIGGDLLPALDLFSILAQENKSTFDWERWRWSVYLLLSISLISITGINLEWLRLRKEANLHSAALINTYQTSFPQDKVIRAPLIQMQQKINDAKKLAGQSSNDDFLVLSGQFAQVWDRVAGSQLTLGVQTVEYREHSLFVKPKNEGEVSIESLRSALKEYGLGLEVKDGVWKISVEIGSVK